MKVSHPHSNNKRLVAHGHVVEDQAHVAVGSGVVEAGGRDGVAVAAGVSTAQRPFPGRMRCRYPTHLGQDPVDVEQAGRLHDARDHQVTEDVIAHRVEPEASVDPARAS